MSHSISCVLLIPSEYRETINLLEEYLGHGPNSISVALVNVDGSLWFGCHTWCDQDFLNELADPAYASEAMSALIISAIEGGDSASNWSNSLAENGLSIVE